MYAWNISYISAILQCRWLWKSCDFRAAAAALELNGSEEANSSVAKYSQAVQGSEDKVT